MSVRLVQVFVGRIIRYVKHQYGRIPRPTHFRIPNAFKTPRRPSSTLLGRFLRPAGRTLIRGTPQLSRAFQAVIGHQGLQLASAGISVVNFHDTRVDSAFDRIREYFLNETNLCYHARYPRTLAGYDIGSFIAKGCNAVVYEAKVKPPQVSGAFASSTRIAQSLSPRAEEPKSLFDAKRQYPLAIKMMFNYDGSNEDSIVREMGGELVPCTDAEIKPFLKWHTAMEQHHKNIVKIITAFVDDVPILPDARRLYPAALPAEMCDEGFGKNKTLFLVMKRYNMTLREYLLLHAVPVRTGQILLGQLLEALTYLSRSAISHRDLKSDNILVDFDEDNEPPRLVLADFGSCMARGTLQMAYPHPDIDLGGNVALRAPEIVRTRFGSRVTLDFSKSDLWAAGTLALEIFTKNNPFYANPTLNETYEEKDLPVLQTPPVPLSIQNLVRKILKVDPKDRPSPICAASVSALSLFGINYIQELLSRIGLRVDFGSKAWSQFRASLTDVISLYAVETVLGRLPESNRRIGKAESALRSAFLSRVDAAVLIEAVQYFEQN